MAIMVRKSRGSVQKLGVFDGQKSISRLYCIQNVKDRIQSGECKINKESVTHFSKFICVRTFFQ